MTGLGAFAVNLCIGIIQLHVRNLLQSYLKQHFTGQVSGDAFMYQT